MSKIRPFIKFTIAGGVTAVLGGGVYKVLTEGMPEPVSAKRAAVTAGVLTASVWACALL